MKGINMVLNPLINCLVCGLEVPENKLRRHLLKVHNTSASKCPVCGLEVLEYKRKSHMQKVHNIVETRWVNCPVCDIKLRRIRLQSHMQNVHNKKKQTINIREHTNNKSQRQPIILKSRRGARVEENRSCNECRLSTNILWRYSASNRGVVYICNRCKEKVRRRSLKSKKVDIMDTRLVLVNAFESNSRRH